VRVKTTCIHNELTDALCLKELINCI